MPFYLPCPQEAGFEAKVIDQRYSLVVGFVWQEPTFRASQTLSAYGFFLCSPQYKFGRKAFIQTFFSPVFPIDSFRVVFRINNDDQGRKIGPQIPAGRAPDFPSRRLRKGKKNEEDGEALSVF